MAAPVLWGDATGTPNDTMFVVINNGPNYYKLHTNAFDTNGTIVSYYWNDQQGWQDSASSDSSHAYQFRVGDINHALALPFVFGVRDDDQILRQKNFVVFADSVPPAPLVATSQPGLPNIKVQWQGMDVKDDSLTQYAIVLGTSSTTLNDTLVNYTPGNNSIFGKSAGWFTYQFNPNNPARTPQYAGNFYLRVLSRDARGSVSVQGNSYTFVVYPY
jgi:hypothetical protein